MLKEAEYRERCRSRGLDEPATEAAVAAVEALEAELGSSPDIGLAAVEAYVAGLVARGMNEDWRLVAIARYFLVTGAENIAIRLLAYLLPVGVLPAMGERLSRLEGADIAARVMSRVSIPASGSPPEAYPAPTAAFVSALGAEVGEVRARRVLAWNVHEIPAAAFAAEREHFLAAPSIEAWLRDYHDREVATLARHAEEGTLWYEQRITPRVVDYVRSEPEILGGVREGSRIFVTKIPYNPDGYLQSSDPLERRRLACHCPLAAGSLRADGAELSPLWCACSAGYTKFMFDVVFGQETQAEVLESVLAGSDRCRFAIAIPESILRGHP